MMKISLSLLLCFPLFLNIWASARMGQEALPSKPIPASSQVAVNLYQESFSSYVASPTAADSSPLPNILKKLGGYPCPDSEFTCVKITVPLDHFKQTDKTIQVVFGVLPASGVRKGMFVTADGGPGGSGLADADSFTDDYGETIRAHFDIVFFDQRGVGASGGFDCPEASFHWLENFTKAETPKQEAALIQNAQTFAQDCAKEIGKPSENFTYLGTLQAIEDLELFRQAVGEEKFWLYGLSYGTEFAQAYTLTHPNHVAGLILDGAVDLTLSAAEYFKEQAQAFNNVLIGLDKCLQDDCNNDFTQKPSEIYDQLAARLEKAAIQIDFPLPSGKKEKRGFTLANLEEVVVSQAYNESDRMLLLRALASNDLVPLLRLYYSAVSVDPETLEVFTDSSFSEASYFAIECMDYAEPSLSSQHRIQSFLRAGDEFDRTLPRLNSLFYGDFPCFFWKGNETARPLTPQKEYLSAKGIPTLVLGAEADPATPLSNNRRIYEHLENGYLITVTNGGPHVIFARGDDCVDEPVIDFLTEGKLPAQRETVCAGQLYDDYIPIAPQNAAEFDTALDALISAEDEIIYLPEYYYWDAETPTTVGCPFGGSLSFKPQNDDSLFQLKNCSFSEGFVMSGKGKYTADNDTFSLNVNVKGIAEGNLSYLNDEEGNYSVKGTYNDEDIDLTQ